MYIDTGKKCIREKEIVGIFDLDRASRKTAEFLSKAEKAGKTERLWDDIPRSFIVTENKVIYAHPTVSFLVGSEK